MNTVVFLGPSLDRQTASGRLDATYAAPARRGDLMAAVHVLRAGLVRREMDVMGAPSPLVPILIGRADVAREATRLLSRSGVLVNLIEYPAVSRATARFRLQVMCSHNPGACESAAMAIAGSIAQARELSARRRCAAA